MKKNDRIKALRIIVSTLLCYTAGVAFSAVWAAEDAASESDATSKPGYYTDSFYIVPEIQITAYHDDNIYATKTAKESDIVTIVSPTLKINSRWDRHSLKLDGGANLGYYTDNTDENYKDYWLEASGRYELGATTSLFGGAGYNKKHESRDSKESAQSTDEPTTYNVQSLQLGGRHMLADYVIRLGLTYENLDFDNVGGLINDDRDRVHTGLGLRVTKDYDKQTKLFVQGLLNERDYDLEQNGFSRDSSGYSVAAGIIKEFGEKDRIEAYAGLLSQDYDYSGFDTVTEPNVGVNLRWYPAESYKLTGNLSRTLSETTQEDASGYLYTHLKLQLDKRMFTDYVGYISYSHGEADYQDDTREDSINSYGIGLNYYMSPKILFSAGYNHVSNDSNENLNDYERNLFLISFKAKLVL